jgi:hypothetical protein
MDTNIEALKLLLGKQDTEEEEELVLDLALEQGNLAEVFYDVQYNLARATLREVLLGCYQHGLYAEGMTLLMTRAWLTTGQACYPNMSDAAVQLWQTHPVEVHQLILEATRKRMYALGGREFDITKLPTMGPLYTEWKPHIQYRAQQPESESTDIAQLNLLESFYPIFERTLRQLQELPDMVLQPRHYHQLMTELALQLYIFSYHQGPKLYYQLASVLDDVYPAAGQNLLKLLALTYTQPERLTLEARDEWIELL